MSSPLIEMVMNATIVTMSHHWNIASAKAGFSRLVRDARGKPQFIENRGRPVAVVLSAEAYERMVAVERSADRWRAVLALSAEIREEGGVDLKIPPRRERRSPFARRA